ncbi:hypothetical protein MKW98_027919, partial [Papaver atlanticum]
ERNYSSKSSSESLLSAASADCGTATRLFSQRSHFNYKIANQTWGRFSDIQDHHLQQGLDNNKLKNISFYTPTQDIPSTQQVYGGHDPHNSSVDWFSSSMNYSSINTNNDSSCANELLPNNSYDIVDDDGMNMHEMLVSDDGLNNCFPIDHEHLGDDDHSMPALCRNTKMESSSVIDHYDQAGSSSELLYGSSSMAMENETSSSTPGKPSSSVGNGNSWVHVDRHMRPFMYPNNIPTVTTTTGFGSSQKQRVLFIRYVLLLHVVYCSFGSCYLLLFQIFKTVWNSDRKYRLVPEPSLVPYLSRWYRNRGKRYRYRSKN